MTKYIVELQQQNKFNILNEWGYAENMLANYPCLDIRSNDYSHIAQLYKNAELFVEIKKCINRKIKINKLNKTLNKYLPSKEERDNLKRLLNLIILFNLIKAQLENKTHEDLRNYGLFDKLNAVNTSMVNWLNLGQLNNLSTAKQINDSMKHGYKYENMRIPQAVDQITEDEYNKIYRIFSLFI